MACVSRRSALGGTAGRRRVVTAASQRALSARQWAVRQLIGAVDLTSAISLGERVAADTARLLGVDHPKASVPEAISRGRTN